MKGKAWTAKAQRRQIRRALNENPESLKGLGLSKARRIGWGQGLTQQALKDALRDGASTPDMSPD